MININQYIIEKLKINKDSKVENRSNYPSESTLDFTNQFFSGISGYLREKAEVISKKYKSVDRILDLWLSIMIRSNSIPYINDNTVNSYPGNYGKEFIDKLIELGMKPQEIVERWEDLNIDKPKDLNTGLLRYYDDRIRNLLNLSVLNYKFELKSFIPSDGDNYTKHGKKILNQRNGITVLPIEVEANNKKAMCEISFLGNKYFSFNVKGKELGIIAFFISELIDQLK